MTYLKEQNRIDYSGKVKLHSEDADLSSDILEALWDSDGKKPKHATARGNVLVRAGTRECKGDTGDYFTDPPERFIVVGKPAELFEPGKARSFAHRLTYFTADDTILLEK
jgi:lipopolysaccharide export system protein LptA